MTNFKDLFESKPWGVYKHINDDDATLVQTYKTEASAKRASKRLTDKNDGWDYYWGLV